MYQDACDRNEIEGKNGTAKRRYGLNRIMSKLDETSKTEAGFSILMMNAWRRVYQELLTDLEMLKAIKSKDKRILFGKSVLLGDRTKAEQYYDLMLDEEKGIYKEYSI